MRFYELLLSYHKGIENYVELGLNVSQIATKIGLHSRELKRYPKEYSAERAQKSYEDSAKQKGRKYLIYLNVNMTNRLI